MDTVVYPDKDVQELAKSFVCIRVDYDKSPELIKRYGVKSLADVRLIDAKGREADCLIGFTSATKLVARGKAVLGGKPTPKTVESNSKKVEVTDANVEAGKQKAVAFLRDALTKGWERQPGFEPGALVLFAWASCGLDSKDDDVSRLIDQILQSPLTATYQTSIRALALSRLDPKKFHDVLQACSEFLAKTQLENGQWTYTASKEDEARKLGDNSNTAYALLGLVACRKAGIEVPGATIRKIEKWWRGSQRADGGWGYRSDREVETYASMTESGISSLVLCGVSKDAALDRALGWLSDHFSVSENKESAYQQGRLLYHLYALERVGTPLKTEKIGGHNWWNEGAAYLLSSQKEDGSWDDGADTPIPNTCFALLFLTRASQFLR